MLAQPAKAVGSGVSSQSQRSCVYPCLIPKPSNLQPMQFPRPPDDLYRPGHPLQPLRPPAPRIRSNTPIFCREHEVPRERSMDLDQRHHLWARHRWWWTQSSWPHFRFTIIRAPILRKQHHNTKPRQPSRTSPRDNHRPRGRYWTRSHGTWARRCSGRRWFRPPSITDPRQQLLTKTRNQPCITPDTSERRYRSPVTVVFRIQVASP